MLTLYSFIFCIFFCNKNVFCSDKIVDTSFQFIIWENLKLQIYPKGKGKYSSFLFKINRSQNPSYVGGFEVWVKGVEIQET